MDQAISEGFLSGEVLAVDSSHLEAFERNPKLDKSKKPTSSVTSVLEESALLPERECHASTKEKPKKPKRHKRGRVPKAEAEEWRRKIDAYEASLTLFEREGADMLPATYQELLAVMPQYASIGVKGDPRGTRRTKFWYGYKLNLMVDTASQYIVTGLTCSAHVNEQRMAILLMKLLQERFPSMPVKACSG